MTIAVAKAQDDLLRQGWALTSASDLLLYTDDIAAAFIPALAPDPRGPGKLHARDVITYDWAPGGEHLTWPVLAEAESIAAHNGTDDYARFPLLSTGHGIIAARAFLPMIPHALRRFQGRMSADLYRYTTGVEAEAHQDKFGDFVFIWVLGRDGDGGANFLTTLDGQDVYRGVLEAGQILVFEDARFTHGITVLKNGHRDVLIFIALKD